MTMILMYCKYMIIIKNRKIDCFEFIPSARFIALLTQIDVCTSLVICGEINLQFKELDNVEVLLSFFQMFEEFFFERKNILKNPSVKMKRICECSLNVRPIKKKNLQYECRVIFLTSRGKITSDIILKDQIRSTLYFTLRRRRILFFGE